MIGPVATTTAAIVSDFGVMIKSISEALSAMYARSCCVM